jgi:hypothetical protein
MKGKWKGQKKGIGTSTEKEGRERGHSEGRGEGTTKAEGEGTARA